MAHLHFQRTVYRSGGGKASQRLEYITRQPERELTAADRQLRYVREGREDLVYERSRNLPAWAQDNPHTYFRAAERYEGVNRVAFEEWKVTLPQELTHAQNMALTRDLVDAIAADKLPITYAFHDPTTMDGRQPQPHLHLLISARQNDAQTRPPAQHFKRYNRAHPARGGAEKDPAFWHRGALKAHRVLIADMLNVHLELHGQVARVHPDTLESRGIPRAPEPKLFPSASRQYREQGVVSQAMAAVLQARQTRAGQRVMEGNGAGQYWEQRKAFLGMTPDMPLAQQRERIQEARAHAVTHHPARTTPHELAQQAQALQQSISGLERYAAPRHGAHSIERAHAARGTQRQRVGQERAERLLAQERDLTTRWEKPLIGNRVSQIYHTPDHKNYGDVHPKHQVHFWTKQEAEDAGYRRAANDHDGRGSGTAMTVEARQRREKEVTGNRHETARATRSVERQLRDLAARLEGEDTPQGGGVRVRLYEQEREQGMGW